MKARLAASLWALGALCLSASPLFAAGAPKAATSTAQALSAAKELSVLRFRLSGTAHGPNVLLKDVIEGDLTEPLASLAIKPAGRPGAKVTVPRTLAQLKLKGAKNAQRLEGPDVCTLSVPTLTIPGSDLQAFADEYLAKQLSGTAGATLVPKGAAKDLETYDAPTRFSIKPNGDDLRGNVVLRLQVLQSGAGGEEREVASVPVSYVVRRQEPRVFATKAYRRGESFSSQGLALKEVDTTFDPGQGFSTIEEVEGKQARAYVAAGKALAADLVELPPLIKRGDIIRVIVKSGSVLVETSGKALRDARKGETLPIELEQSHKQVQARCVEIGVAVREAF